MRLDQATMSAAIREVCGRHSELEGQLLTAKTVLESLSSEIDDIKSEISDLKVARKGSGRDYSYYSGLIDDAYDQKQRLLDNIREKKAEIRQYSSDLRDVRSQAKDFRHELESVKRELLSHGSKLPTTTPGWAAQDISLMKHTVNQGLSFCTEYINFLNSEVFNAPQVSDAEIDEITHVAPEESARIFNAGQATKDLELPRIPLGLGANRAILKTSASTSLQEPDLLRKGEKGDTWEAVREPDGSISPLRLYEPPTKTPYRTAIEGYVVPCLEYIIVDSVDVAGASTEVIGVRHSDAFLRATGHKVIFHLGGKGAPDILSLDDNDDLWVSEVKGTLVSTPLYKTGLKRPLKKPLFENSPEWLTLCSARTEQALQSAIDAETDVEKQRLLVHLKSKYLEAKARNFSELYCKNQVIQIGICSTTNYLKPPYMLESKELSEFFSTVRPSQVVQINVMAGTLE